MSDNLPATNSRRPLPLPNPVTRKAHRREVLRQVTVPLVIGLLILVGVVVWLIIADVGTVERWAEIAMVFLTVPALLIGLVVLVVLAGLSYLIGRILQLLPPYTRLTQDAIMRIDHQIKSGADLSVQPLIQIQSFIAMIDKLFGKI